MSKPFFSIVVPSYNRAELILNTLRTLLDQTYSDYEVIIVDDGSTDNSKEVLEPFINEKVHYYKIINSERGAARNYGAKKAKGEYINFFDSDDIALPNHLEVAEKVIIEKNNPEWFHLGFARTFPDKIAPFNPVSFSEPNTLNHLMYQGNPLSCNAVFVRKDIILDNLFNEDRSLSSSEDYELWLRLSVRFPLYYSNEITSLVVYHDDRSVITISPEKVIKRQLSLLNSVQLDQEFKKLNKKEINGLKMAIYLNIISHISSIAKFKLKSLKYIFTSMYCSCRVFKNKAFYASLKNLFFKWQK